MVSEDTLDLIPIPISVQERVAELFAAARYGPELTATECSESVNTMPKSPHRVKVFYASKHSIAIGPKGTTVAPELISAIDWSLKPTDILHIVLCVVFGSEMLAPHNLLNESANCSKNLQLCPIMVSDIVHFMTTNTNIKQEDVCQAISKICMDIITQSEGEHSRAIGPNRSTVADMTPEIGCQAISSISKGKATTQSEGKQSEAIGSNETTVIDITQETGHQAIPSISQGKATKHSEGEHSSTIGSNEITVIDIMQETGHQAISSISKGKATTQSEEEHSQGNETTVVDLTHETGHQAFSSISKGKATTQSEGGQGISSNETTVVDITQEIGHQAISKISKENVTTQSEAEHGRATRPKETTVTAEFFDSIDWTQKPTDIRHNVLRELFASQIPATYNLSGKSVHGPEKQQLDPKMTANTNMNQEAVRQAISRIGQEKTTTQVEEERSRVIGPNGTTVAAELVDSIDWSLKPTTILRNILHVVFGRDILASHNLSGNSRHGSGKEQLDPNMVADIVHFMTANTKMTDKTVRATISWYCSHETMRERQPMRILGPNGTTVAAEFVDSIDWSQKPATILYNILHVVFGSSILATHNLSGKRRRSTENQQLNPIMVADVVHFMTENTNMNQEAVRQAISNICCDKARKQLEGEHSQAIGPNGTTVAPEFLNSIDWSLRPSRILRKLLQVVFGNEILASHCLTGTKSGKPQLNPMAVADIIHFMTGNKQMTQQDVRSTISSICKDEAKKHYRRAIGPNGTTVARDFLNSIDWSQPPTRILYKLLHVVFGRKILATHNLSGNSRDGFGKRQLDAKIVADIVHYMTKNTKMSREVVRLTIARRICQYASNSAYEQYLETATSA